MKLPLLPTKSGVALQLQTAEGVIGGSVWPSAGFLCQYLLDHYYFGCDIRQKKMSDNERTAHQRQFQSMKVLELGSGTGAVGIFAAGLGVFQSVYLTEHRPPMAAVIPSVAYNVDGSLDWEFLEGRDDEGYYGSGDMPKTSDRLLNLLQRNVDINATPEFAEFSSWPPTVHELDWGIPEHSDRILEETDSPDGMDLLLASDLTYQSELHDALSFTMARLLSTKNPESKCLLVHQQRILNLKGLDHQMVSLESALERAGLRISKVQEASSENSGAHKVDVLEIQHDRSKGTMIIKR